MAGKKSLSQRPSEFDNFIFKDSHNAPFKNACASKQLERIALSLTAFVNAEASKKSLIISIDAPYGMGKSTFIDMWGQSILNRGLAEQNSVSEFAIKFDAWKADYIEDPLVAIIGEMATQFDLIPYKLNIQQQVKDIATIGKGIFLASTKLAASMSSDMIKKFVGVDIEDIGSFIKEIKEAVLPETDNNLPDNPHLIRKTLLQGFKMRLKEIINLSGIKVLYFFIDELDRCKPTFAIQVLEIIKHVFDIPQTCFVLSMNKPALLTSISKVYGYQEEKAAEYLERFIDISVTLPKLNTNDFFAYEAKDLLSNRLVSEDKDIASLIKYCCEQLASPRIIKKYIWDLTLLFNSTHFTTTGSQDEWESDNSIDVLPYDYCYAVIYLLHLKRFLPRGKWHYDRYFSSMQSSDDAPHFMTNISYPINENWKIKAHFSYGFLYASRDRNELIKYCEARKKDINQMKRVLNKAQQDCNTIKRQIIINFVHKLYESNEYSDDGVNFLIKLNKYTNHFNIIHKKIEFLSYFNQEAKEPELLESEK